MKTLGELIDNLEVLATSGAMDVPISSVCYDSRQVVDGSLFVCIPGTRVDGHAYIGDAVSRGAAAIVARSEPQADLPASFVRVRDPRKALAAVAANFYDHPASRLTLIGITGTNGKTTTSLLIESILRAGGHNPGVIGTIAYRWAEQEIPAPMTTPESLDLQRIFDRMAKERVTHVVMEVSSHALALGRINGCAFRAGVFTNLSQDHLDFHPTMEEYFEAKRLLFARYLAPDASAVVINADDPYGRRLLENGALSRSQATSYSAGSANAALISPRDVRFGQDGISARIATPHGEIAIDSRLVGRLNLYNILAAVATAVALGIPAPAIAEGIRAVGHVDGRLQRVPVPSECGFGVIVDYAHTPDAMDKALSCLREMTENRLIAVFGCGGDRDRGKRPIMGKVAADLADLVIITSDNPRTEVPDFIVDEIEAGVKSGGIARLDGPPEPGRKYYLRETDRRRAIELALSLARPGDILFIGGKGHETYQIIGRTKYSFDDRIVVKEYFEKKA
ncbi:MAG: UDP-N-acetylmuramoyl-L-alanyl-D-glutamate--2,6-diaminopimelate ligase [Desulfobacteraceae bacterium]|nr:UDP-N-acetylmuramoyl-L-alanyl-D-glutamate--2,6-diaminopimelate ligase [Desulfobacteraceae bacterium]